MPPPLISIFRGQPGHHAPLRIQTHQGLHDALIEAFAPKEIQRPWIPLKGFPRHLGTQAETAEPEKKQIGTEPYDFRNKIQFAVF